MPLRKHLAALVLVCGISRNASAQKSASAVSAPDTHTYADLMATTDTRRFDSALVDSALASGWQPLRAAAALAIGQVGAEQGLAGVSRLRTLLADREVSVAANAAYAIGLLRDPVSVPALSAALSRNHEVAREAAWALGEIGAPARGAITSALDISHPTDVTVQLLLAAAKLRPIPLVDIKPFLRRGSPPTVWAASYAIARSRAPAGASSLIELASSLSLKAKLVMRDLVSETTPAYSDPLSAIARTRAEIARGLAKSAAGDSLSSKAFAVLSRLAGDADPHVRINAVRSIGTYGPPAKRLLLNATRDTDANVRVDRFPGVARCGHLAGIPRISSRIGCKSRSATTRADAVDDEPRLAVEGGGRIR